MSENTQSQLEQVAALIDGWRSNDSPEGEMSAGWVIGQVKEVLGLGGMFSEETKKHEEALQRAATETRARYCASWTGTPTEEAQCAFWAEAIRPLFETAQKRLSTLDYLRHTLSVLLKEVGETPCHDLAEIIMQIMKVMRRAQKPLTEEEARKWRQRLVRQNADDAPAYFDEVEQALMQLSRGEIPPDVRKAEMAVTAGTEEDEPQ